MTRFTSAYSVLIQRLEEVHSLEKIASSYASAKPLGSYDKEISALCRGAIVLLSAHIEGFIDDLASIIIQRIHESKVKKTVFGEGFRYYFRKI